MINFMEYEMEMEIWKHGNSADFELKSNLYNEWFASYDVLG